MSSCRVKPLDAPSTALASSARSRPCFDRSGPLSPLRATVTVPSSPTATGKPSNSGCWTFPFGPSAGNTPSLNSTPVPFGTRVVLREVGVPDPGQQIRDGVGHAHRSLLELLPAGLDHAGEVPLQREVAEVDAAEPELAVEAARAAADLAPVAVPDLELLLAVVLGDFCGGGHSIVS